MPELPEVETLCRQLRQVILGERITKSEVLDTRLGKQADLGGRRVLSIQRRGKTLEMGIEDDITLCLQLRMTGRFSWQAAAGNPPRARFYLAFGHGFLFLTDIRRLATLSIARHKEEGAAGMEPMEGLDARRLKDRAAGRRLPVKNFLMDQKAVAGIGNIYVCEILYESRVSPLREVSEISAREWKRIAEASARILSTAIDCRGTSVSDWRDLHGKKGTYQNHLRVYRRAGQGCPRCGSPIRRVALSGRGTFYCPSCQT